MATLRSLVLASYVPVSEEPIASALAVRETAPGGAPKPRLLDRVREAASTQNQALSALLFLYRAVLGQDLPWLDDVVRAKGPQRLPVVLTRAEVRAVIQQLEGTPRLMALLMYGAGLRLLECARLRVQDLDFSSNQTLVRAGKGNKDRVTMLPAATKGDLARQLERVEAARRGARFARRGPQPGPGCRVPPTLRLCRHDRTEWVSEDGPVFGQRVAGASYVLRPSVYALIKNAVGQVAVVRTAQGVFLPGGGIEMGEIRLSRQSRERS